jgi:hypothetical protein
VQHSHIIAAIDASPMNRGKSGAEWFAEKGNVAIEIDEDIFLFDREGPGYYQIHFLTCEGGKATVARCKAAFKIMFDEHGASLLFGLVPVSRRDVAVMANRVGGIYARMVPTPFEPCRLYIVPKGRIQ